MYSKRLQTYVKINRSYILSEEHMEKLENYRPWVTNVGLNGEMTLMETYARTPPSTNTFIGFCLSLIMLL